MPVSKTERLLNLLAFLLNTPQPVTLAEITEKVEGYRGARAKASATRCFERDKAELSAMGISIEYVSGDSFNPAAYFLDRSRYFMPVISMTEDERLLLAVAVRLARSQGSNECSDHLFWAIQKLVFDRPYLGQSGPEPKEPPVEEKSDAGRLSLLCALARAAALRSSVTFLYFGIGSNRVERDHNKISPSSDAGDNSLSKISR